MGKNAPGRRVTGNHHTKPPQVRELFIHHLFINRCEIAKLTQGVVEGEGGRVALSGGVGLAM